MALHGPIVWFCDCAYWWLTENCNTTHWFSRNCSYIHQLHRPGFSANTLRIIMLLCYETQSRILSVISSIFLHYKYNFRIPFSRQWNSKLLEIFKIKHQLTHYIFPSLTFLLHPSDFNFTSPHITLFLFSVQLPQCILSSNSFFPNYGIHLPH